MRGEHLAPIAQHAPDDGSPPHARGALCGVIGYTPDPGITPACAGSTAAPDRRYGHSRDHPRMRGEHPCRPPLPGGHPGSPPHARGALHIGGRTFGSNRITPACAGSTANTRQRIPGSPDHPRMRGEHGDRDAGSGSAYGSPPHARGALRYSTRTVGRLRITPACAGSTGPRSPGPNRLTDHPRMRGEHQIHHPVLRAGQGSPPHARGARARQQDRCSMTGITPACAGSTP